ncbi:hypothetical protein [Bacillus phage vB_BanS-Thrax5]|nr:hypothetical protein [Bacillus phage vB_BanS-Thrax5]
MRLGDVYSRKDYEYTIVGKIRHEDDSCYVYTIKQREYGQDEVSYFVHCGDFTQGYVFINNELDE